MGMTESFSALGARVRKPGGLTATAAPAARGCRCGTVGAHTMTPQLFVAWECRSAFHAATGSLILCMCTIVGGELGVVFEAFAADFASDCHRTTVY